MAVHIWKKVGQIWDSFVDGNGDLNPTSEFTVTIMKGSADQLKKGNDYKITQGQKPTDEKIYRCTKVTASPGKGSANFQLNTSDNALAISENKKDIYNSLKNKYQEGKRYSIYIFKEFLLDLQSVNYQWFTLSVEKYWSAKIPNHPLLEFELAADKEGMVYSEIVQKLSEALQAAEEVNILVDPYTPEGASQLILRVSEAISTSARIPYLLRELVAAVPIRQAFGAGGNSDIKVIVENLSEDEVSIVLFQQDPNIKGMFDKIFPTAWKVFPLKPSTDTKTSRGSTTYPIQQGIGVTRKAASSDALPYGDLDLTIEVDANEIVEYTISQSGALDLNSTGDYNEDGTISCINSSDERSNIALYKNGSVVVAQPGVASGESADFLLTLKLYAMWVREMKEGAIFKSQIKSPEVTSVDLTNKRSVTFTLKTTGTGGKKGWDVTTT
ncbi:hypothetical protein [Microcoleus sp. B4-D4]|uniref:hypothetical protein n=1 Tax=Microcoleus sp. B4-D4 TaxID=2818667 RepID=UPI002FD1BAA2